jgi:uncharacterized protein (DUF952 family)
VLVYKILRASEWETLRREGITAGAPIDVEDGFVHLSDDGQVEETAARHFAGIDGLVLLALDADALGEALRWEPSRGGALFPHLYRALQRADICWDSPLPLVDGRHRFPPLGGKRAPGE